jgi:hypothetical protein
MLTDVKSGPRRSAGSRPRAETQPEDAIRIARATQRRIAAKITRGETAYVKKHLEPHIDGKNIHLASEKSTMSKNSRSWPRPPPLLFPIDWPELFGLVMIEAMACGTPVIANRSGSVPAVIEDGDGLSRG